MDIIIPLSKGSYWMNKELRYCLRSIEKYLPEFGTIYIIGEKPHFVKNIINIPCDDPYPEINKGANIIRKLITASNNPDISNTFLFVSDDQVFLKKISLKKINPYYIYDLRDFKFSGNNKFWMDCLRNTKDTLLKEGLQCYNFEPHTPVRIDKKKFIKVMAKYDWMNISYPTLSLYFNNVIKKPKQLPENYRVFYGEEDADLNLLKFKKFMGYSDLALSWKLQMKLKELFPTKSKFEK